MACTKGQNLLRGQGREGSVKALPTSLKICEAMCTGGYKYLSVKKDWL